MCRFWNELSRESVIAREARAGLHLPSSHCLTALPRCGSTAPYIPASDRPELIAGSILLDLRLYCLHHREPLLQRLVFALIR